MEFVSKISLRKEYDDSLGPINYLAARRDKVVLISFPFPLSRFLLLISAEPSVNIENLASKVIKIFGDSSLSSDQNLIDSKSLGLKSSSLDQMKNGGLKDITYIDFAFFTRHYKNNPIISIIPIKTAILIVILIVVSFASSSRFTVCTMQVVSIFLFFTFDTNCCQVFLSLKL